MKKVLLILAILLIPAAAFAEEKITARENKPAPASAKKGKEKEKCVIPKLEHEEKLPSGETITIKDPIPDNLSDKCYCDAVRGRYITYLFNDPNEPRVCIADIYMMTERELECMSDGIKKTAYNQERRRIHSEALKNFPLISNCSKK